MKSNHLYTIMTDFRINVQFLRCNAVFSFCFFLCRTSRNLCLTCDKKRVTSELILRISLRACALVELFLNEAVCVIPRRV